MGKKRRRRSFSPEFKAEAIGWCSRAARASRGRAGARPDRDLARGTTGWRHRRCRLTGPWGMANTNAPTNPRGAFFAPRAPPRRAAASRSPPGHPSCQCTRGSVARPPPSVHDLLAQGEADQLGRLVEVELLHDLLAVPLHRAQAEREGGRDLCVGAPLGDELEDLALPPRESREVVVAFPRRLLA